MGWPAKLRLPPRNVSLPIVTFARLQTQSAHVCWEGWGKVLTCPGQICFLPEERKAAGHFLGCCGCRALPWQLPSDHSTLSPKAAEEGRAWEGKAWEGRAWEGRACSQHVAAVDAIFLLSANRCHLLQFPDYSSRRRGKTSAPAAVTDPRGLEQLPGTTSSAGTFVEGGMHPLLSLLSPPGRAPTTPALPGVHCSVPPPVPVSGTEGQTLSRLSFLEAFSRLSSLSRLHRCFGKPELGYITHLG